jgi:hypothetical protein
MQERVPENPPFLAAAGGEENKKFSTKSKVETQYRGNTKDIDSEICRSFSYTSLSTHPVGDTATIVPFYTLMLAIRL